MYILAIETTGPFGSVALMTEDVLLGKEISADTMNHLKDLVPMMERLLKKAAVAKSELSYIAASAGPGSFTGIRIGVSTARALGQALAIPVISVPTLETFLYKETEKERSSRSEAGEQKKENLVCGILNARRGQVYGIVEDYMPAGPYMLTEVLDVIKKKAETDERPVVFFGDGIDAYEEKILKTLQEAGMQLGKDFLLTPEEDRYQDAASVARLALEKIRRGQVLSYWELHPDYMRKAEAEQKLEAGQLPICKLPRQE